ncbi:hypothetical protein CDAR_370161 [Caerostris darwini]|uniref:Uncharacterized protein n=1 Tax=Caerostris darwini TaxID=1538125 RepID=A0AAV4TGU0_9ARAC|nr:hypothetical protein CDAR_370161 [Caerostris darwini]
MTFSVRQEVRSSQLLPVSSANLPQLRSQKQSVPSGVISQSSSAKNQEFGNNQLLPVSSVNLPQPKSQKQSVPSSVLSQSSSAKKSEIVSFFQCPQTIFLS